MNGIQYSYRVLTYVFAAAVQNYEVHVHGDRLFYQEGTIDCSVRLDSTGNDPISLNSKEPVAGKSGAEFRKFFLSVAGAGTVTLIVSKGLDVNSSRIDIDTIEYVEKTTVGTFGNIVVTDAAGGTVVSVSNPTRRKITLQPIDGTVYIGLGAVAVTTLIGYRLGEGESITLDSFTGEIRAICGVGLSVNVRVLREGA